VTAIGLIRAFASSGRPYLIAMDALRAGPKLLLAVPGWPCHWLAGALRPGDIDGFRSPFYRSAGSDRP
jgi:hypothetical protein